MMPSDQAPPSDLAEAAPPDALHAELDRLRAANAQLTETQQGRAAIAADLTARLSDLEGLLTALAEAGPDRTPGELVGLLQAEAAGRGGVGPAHVDLLRRLLERFAAPATAPTAPGDRPDADLAERLAAAEAHAERALLRQNQLEQELAARQSELARQAEAIRHLPRRAEEHEARAVQAALDAQRTDHDEVVRRLSAETVQLMQALLRHQDTIADRSRALAAAKSALTAARAAQGERDAAHEAETRRMAAETARLMQGLVEKAAALQQAGADLAQLRQTAKTQKRTITEQKQRIADQKGRIRAFESSSSWKLTRPIRVVGRMLK